MKCPKCTGTMVEHQHSEGISIRRCTTCCGMLLTSETLLRIRQAVRVDEFFDIGHPKVGKSLDAVDPVDCPACHQPMVATNDPQQTHIRFEICPQCQMLFLDAGELIDLSHETALEKLRDLLARKLGWR